MMKINKKLLCVVAIGGVILPATFCINNVIEQNKMKDVVIEELNNLKDTYVIKLDEEKLKINDLMIQLETSQGEIEQLKDENNSLEVVRQTIINTIGYFPSEKEIDLLTRLVECEAGGESMKGKMAVANVVVNRLSNKKFPETIKGVIMQKNQFEPVVTGMIDTKEASADSKEAVKKVLLGDTVVPSDIVNFWAGYLPKSHDLWNHIDTEFVIGVHHFGKGWK